MEFYKKLNKSVSTYQCEWLFLNTWTDVWCNGVGTNYWYLVNAKQHQHMKSQVIWQQLHKLKQTKNILHIPNLQYSLLNPEDFQNKCVIMLLN